VDLCGDKVIPITILPGFLGAGKTTLLNRILYGDHGLRVAVVVNDSGAINIDAALVIEVQDDVISLANGCVCCTIRDDLIETVAQTINRREAPEYILIEASGVADPSRIAMTFVNPELQDRIRLDSITCVVDADQIFAYPEHPAVEQLKLRQIAFADMMILNKSTWPARSRSRRFARGLTATLAGCALSKPATAMCRWQSCWRSGGSTPPGRALIG
jgi:G3E family GTPase